MSSTLAISSIDIDRIVLHAEWAGYIQSEQSTPCPSQHTSQLFLNGSRCHYFGTLELSTHDWG